MLFGIFEAERRSFSLENPKVSLTDPAAWASTFGGGPSAAGVTVDEKAALGVPAIWQAVNLIAGTIGHLPLHLYKVDKDGNAVKAVTDPLYRVIHDRASNVHTKSAFFKLITMRALLGGRGIALILRNQAGRAAGFLPLKEGQVTIDQKIVNGQIIRTYTNNETGKTYQSWDIIDIAPVLEDCGIKAISPITVNRDAIGAMIAAERYATSLFRNGGVPPLTLTGPASSPAAADRAGEQISEALRVGRNRQRNILPMPTGFELKSLGFDPAKQQMIELRHFQISEASRIFNVAPAMLHDLSTGTYSNVEQQNLNFAQQTILPLVKLIEQELNLKLYGERNTSNFVEFNVDALVRGDLLSRMEALAKAVQTALLTPNEARALDNRPALPHGDKLLIQGATVPLGQAPAAITPTTKAPDEEPKTIGENENDQEN